MTRYKFSQDRKHTIWTRTHFTIDAPTQAEAIAKAATLVGQDVEDAEAEDEQINIKESETLYNSLEDILVEENSGNSTIDILFDNGDDLADYVTGVTGGKRPTMSSWSPLQACDGQTSTLRMDVGLSPMPAESGGISTPALRKSKSGCSRPLRPSDTARTAGAAFPAPMSGTMPFNASTAMRIFTAPKSSPHPRHDRRN